MPLLWNWYLVLLLCWISSEPGSALPAKFRPNPPANILDKTSNADPIVFNEKTFAEILNQFMDKDQLEFLDNQQDPWLNLSGKQDEKNMGLRSKEEKWYAPSEKDFLREFQRTLEEFNQVFQPLEQKKTSADFDDGKLYEMKSSPSNSGNQQFCDKVRSPHGSSQDCQPQGTSGFQDRFFVPKE